MLKHLLKTLLLISVALLVHGCATTGNASIGMGFVTNYSDSGGLGAPLKKTSKHGEACAYNLLGVAFGDASISAAKAKAGISLVSHFDRSYLNVLFLYGKYCTTVHGV